MYTIIFNFKTIFVVNLIGPRINKFSYYHSLIVKSPKTCGMGVIRIGKDEKEDWYCVLVVAFRGRTGLDSLVEEVVDPVYSPIDHILCKVGVFR